MAEGKKGVKLARFDLMPIYPLWQIALVYGDGAAKYAERNWERGMPWSKLIGAAERHLQLFKAGQDIDPESGRPHLAHVAWHMLGLLQYMLTHPELDDRSKLPDDVLEAMYSEAAVTNPDEIEAARAEAHDPEWNGYERALR